LITNLNTIKKAYGKIKTGNVFLLGADGVDSQCARQKWNVLLVDYQYYTL